MDNDIIEKEEKNIPEITTTVMTDTIEENNTDLERVSIVDEFQIGNISSDNSQLIENFPFTTSNPSNALQLMKGGNSFSNSLEIPNVPNIPNIPGPPNFKKTEIPIEPIFYTILDYCIEISEGEKINVQDFSKKNLCKVLAHTLRYINNIISVRKISTRETFDDFLNELISSEYLAIIKENAVKVSEDWEEDTLFNGPVADYLFGENMENIEKENNERKTSELNYIIACTEFLACQIVYSFKGKTNKDIEKMLSKISIQ